MNALDTFNISLYFLCFVCVVYLRSVYDHFPPSSTLNLGFVRKLASVEVYNNRLSKQWDNVLDKSSVDGILLDVVVSVLLALELDNVGVCDAILLACKKTLRFLYRT